MTDTGQGPTDSTGALVDLARQAAYVVIGMAVIEVQKAQVRRQQLLRGHRMAKRAKDFDTTVTQMINAVDSTLEPMLERLPESAQAMVRQARETRDELRTRVFGSSL